MVTSQQVIDKAKVWEADLHVQAIACASPAERERRLVKEFRHLSDVGKVVAVLYVMDALAAERRQARQARRAATGIKGRR